MPNSTGRLQLRGIASVSLSCTRWIQRFFAVSIRRPLGCASCRIGTSTSSTPFLKLAFASSTFAPWGSGTTRVNSRILARGGAATFVGLLVVLPLSADRQRVIRNLERQVVTPEPPHVCAHHQIVPSFDDIDRWQPSHHVSQNG